MRHHAQRFADAFQEAQQIAAALFAGAAETTQIAKQHGDFGFSRSKHALWIVGGQRFHHHGGEELTQARLAATESVQLSQAAERGGGHFGEFDVVSQVGSIAVTGIARRAEAESARNIQSPTATSIAGQRRAVGPIDAFGSGEIFGRGTGPGVQHRFALGQALLNETLAGLKGGFGQTAAIPMEDAHRRVCRGWIIGSLVGRRFELPASSSHRQPPRPRHRLAARRPEAIHQPHEKFVFAGRIFDDVGQAAEQVDALMGVAEGELLQFDGAEDLFAVGMRGIDRHLHLLSGERERGVADDEVFARRDLERGHGFALDEDGVAGRRDFLDRQPRAVPSNLDMLPRNVIVPRRRPSARLPADDDGLIAGHGAAASGERIPGLGR